MEWLYIVYMKFGYINKFTAQTNKRSELIELLLQASKALETNEGCLYYLVSSSENEPAVVYVHEVWSSKQAHDASLSQTYIKTIIAKAMPLVASISNVAELQLEGGKGLS